MLEKNVEYKVKGYTNRWSLIDQLGGYGLLENNTWGDETCYLVVKMDQEALEKRYKNRDSEVVMIPTIQEVVCETYDGLEVALGDEGLLPDDWEESKGVEIKVDPSLKEEDGYLVGTVSVEGVLYPFDYNLKTEEVDVHCYSEPSWLDGSSYEKPLPEVVTENMEDILGAVSEAVDGYLNGTEKAPLDEVIHSCERMSKEKDKGQIDLSEYEMMPSQVDGFDIYRKIVHGEDGLPRGVWAAQKEGGEPFEITYKQARGLEPIDDSGIKGLSRQLGAMLLP